MVNRKANTPVMYVANADENYFGTSRFERETGIKFFAELPYDKECKDCENAGIPVIEGYKGSIFKNYPKHFNDFVKKLMKEITSVNSKNSLLIDNTNTGGETNG